MTSEDLAKYKGKRYINIVRCSNDSQVETSIPGQLDLMNGKAQPVGLIHAGDVILDGVSGSKPGNREDIQEIIERKQVKNDFEVALIQTEDRWTRSGSEHGNWMSWEFKRHGIIPIFVSSDVPNGRYGPLLRTMKYEAAQETAISTSLRSTQGFQRALENRNVATCSHAPYGLDRLYCSATVQPLFVIRDNGDGTQHKLDVESGKILETYGTVGGGAEGHYRKQKSEKVFLVPGVAAKVAVIQKLFQLRYVEGEGPRRMANLLNAEGIVAPEGGRWSARQVDVVVENEVYTGVSVASRTASGRYHQRAKGAPQAVELDPTVIANNKTLPVRLRPPEEWVYQEQPYLKELLHEPLRSIAREKIKQIWTERCRPGRQKRVCNKHPDSKYILTGLLRAKHDGRLLKGYTSGPAGRKVRYYVHSLAQRDPIRAGVPNTTFRADALEAAFLMALTETLKSMPDLRQEVASAVTAAQAASHPPDEIKAAELRQRHATLSKRILAILDVIDADAPEAKTKIAELRRQQREIEDQLKKREESVAIVPQDELVDSILTRLADLGQTLGDLPVYQLRQVLGALVASMTADLKTREVSIVLRVPPLALQDAATSIEALSLRLTSRPPIESETQHQNPHYLVKIDCQFERKSQKPCFQCSRRRAA